MGTENAMKRWAGLCGVAFLFACQQSTHTTPPAPAPLAVAPQNSEPIAATLDEARSLRTSGKLIAYEASLKVLARSTDAQTRARATTLLGLFELDQKRAAEALVSLRQAAELSPSIAPYLRLRIAELDPANAIATLQQIIQETPASSAATVARLRLPGYYALAGNIAAADSAMTATAAISIDELTESDFVELAATLEKANHADLATAIRLRLLTQFPQGRFTETTYAKLAQLDPSPLDAISGEAALDLARRLGTNDRYDQDLDLLARIARRFPDQPATAAYRTIRLRALFNTRRYRELLTETASLKVSDPALALMRARAAWRAGQPADFLAGLNQVERDFPQSPQAIEAKVLRAKYYTTDETNYDVAIADLRGAVDAGASGGEGENLWNLGWTYVLAHRDDEALQTFDRYARTFPDGDYLSNSLFWSAKIFDRRGLIAERDAKFRTLIASYPFSYYSYRAKQLMGGVPATPTFSQTFPDITIQLDDVGTSRFAAVQELAYLGLMRDATRELKLLAAANPDNLGLAFALADLYVQAGEPFKANGVLQRRFRQFVRHGGNDIPQRFWEILFPLNYWETIRDEAGRRQIDPYLVASIIRQESGFEPTVVSNAGAVGIMQIMPAEAASIAARAGLIDVTRESLFDPKINIAVGAAEFVQKLAAVNGNDTLAIAAYNAGEDAVGKWIAHTPIDDIDLFVESIPYSETRLYVKSVTRNRFEYRRIYDVASGSTQQQTARR
ncbi:MAG: Soluble lytic murein transglycosylase and related regulatory protein [Acidobacteria bacterium]|nr:Soluble lytic murein transglycosylase and related regulatory protein [Acidobacteriota bacterium]